VVAYKDKQSFVVADIPGLIEGAAEGHGLGVQFLRHVERCRVLVHLVDLGCVDEGRSPLHDLDVIDRELARYSPLLAEKPQVVVANKLDLQHARDAFPAFEKALRRRHVEVLPLSGATGEGLQKVLDACARVLFSARPPPMPRLRRQAPAKVKPRGAAVPRLRTGRTVTNRRGSPRKKGPRA
jgi:GTP-binding protein